jgi:hypothetical protein
MLRTKFKVLGCCFNLYTLSFTSSIHSQKFLHISSKSRQKSCLPFLIPFNWCDIMSALKSINNWTFDFACLVGVWSLCEPLLPWGKNLHHCLEPTLCQSTQSNDLLPCCFINIYFLNRDKLLLLHVCSHIQLSYNIHAICFALFWQTPKLFSQQRCFLMRKMLTIISCAT